MPTFNDESKIFEQLQSIDVRDCLLLHDDLVDVYSMLYDEGWIYNAKNTNFPPDYYNKNLKYMMEIMRVDDHAKSLDNGKILNESRVADNKTYHEIKHFLQKSGLPDMSILVTSDSGLPTDEDHNYDYYRTEFLRVVQKHIDNIPVYRDNHPNNKLIFTIFDESSQYFEICPPDNKGLLKPHIKSIAHDHFRDFSFMNIFRGSDVDYVFWMTPYKHIPNASKEGVPNTPRLTIIDVKRINIFTLVEYNPKLMKSNER